MNGTTVEYHRFDTPRRPEQYQGQAGPHVGLALPPEGLEAIAVGKMNREPTGMIVRGEWIRKEIDGTETRFLDLAVTAAYIEAHTNYRADANGKLRWTCPECDRVGGGHAKTCGFE